MDNQELSAKVNNNTSDKIIIVKKQSSKNLQKTKLSNALRKNLLRRKK
jgi:hypothetical protein